MKENGLKQPLLADTGGVTTAGTFVSKNLSDVEGQGHDDTQIAQTVCPEQIWRKITKEFEDMPPLSSLGMNAIYAWCHWFRAAISELEHCNEHANAQSLKSELQQNLGRFETQLLYAREHELAKAAVKNSVHGYDADDAQREKIRNKIHAAVYDRSKPQLQRQLMECTQSEYSDCANTVTTVLSNLYENKTKFCCIPTSNLKLGARFEQNAVNDIQTGMTRMKYR